MKSVKTLILTCAIAATLVAANGAYSAEPTRVRGEILSVDATTLSVRARGGDTISIGLKPDQAVAAVQNVTLDAIKPGVFIGTAARPGAGGQLVALEVVVFPEAARGTGEGHYGWDLFPDSSMTNANVDSMVQGVNGRDLALSYKGGNTKVTVPAGVPIVTVVPASLADLKAGKKIFVVASGEPGALSAVRIIVEKDGVVPPM